jgi:hypothetical protein
MMTGGMFFVAGNAFVDGKACLASMSQQMNETGGWLVAFHRADS